MINLETEATLRVEQAGQLEIACAAGVVWITQEGDLRDLFVAAGESLMLKPTGLTLITALEPSTVRIHERTAAHATAGSWRQLAARLVARPRLAVRA